MGVQPMQEKFSYFDFIAYFVPGTVLLWSISVALKGAQSLERIGLGNVITDSLVFIVLAFVAGHLVQSISKKFLEGLLKRIYWSGAFVSEQCLIKGNPFFSEFKREQYIQIAKVKFRFKAEDLEILEKGDLKNVQAKNVSHDVYRVFDAFVKDNQIGERASIANTYYNFFRGLVVSCFIATILFLFVREWMLIMVFGLASYMFLGRAKQRGELYIAGIFDSVLGFHASQ